MQVMPRRLEEAWIRSGLSYRSFSKVIGITDAVLLMLIHPARMDGMVRKPELTREQVQRIIDYCGCTEDFLTGRKHEWGDPDVLKGKTPYPNNLRTIRLLRGVSIERIGIDLRIEPSRLRTMERHTEKINSLYADLFARYFGVTKDYILGKSDQRYPN